jgi:hypothetical protein
VFVFKTGVEAALKLTGWHPNGIIPDAAVVFVLFFSDRVATWA